VVSEGYIHGYNIRPQQRDPSDAIASPERSRKPSLAKDSGPSQTGPSTNMDHVLNTQTHSGTIHPACHKHCVPESGDTARLVATIYYNGPQPRHLRVQSSQAKPTVSLSEQPLEQPPAEPEPLDHLSDSYLSQRCLTHFLSTVDSVLIQNSPEQRRLTSSHRCLSPDSSKPRVMEITFSLPPNPEHLPLSLVSKHDSISRFEREWNCEIVWQPCSVYRRHKRLCVFDMDSTLIHQEVIDEIAAVIGVQKEVSAITERAMNGELDFAASLKARVALLKGVPSDVFERLKPQIRITAGAKELCKCLKRLGFTLAVLSGGFQPLANWLAGELGLDHAFANHLISDPSTQTLTGELDPDYPIVDAQHKLNLLLDLAAESNIPLAQTMAVGDGANDIPMLKKAGLGIAWRAKSKVQMEAPARLNVGESMLDLVYLLGLTKAEVDELLTE